MFVNVNVINALAHWQCMLSNPPVCSFPFFFKIILLHVNKKKQKRSQQVYYDYIIYVLDMTVYMYMTIYV